MAQGDLKEDMALGADQLRTRLRASRLYVVTDDLTPLAEVPALVEAAVAGGADLVQLRCKREPWPGLVGLAQSLRETCRRGGAIFLVNDHVDLALAAGADGVHLGQGDTAVEEARERLGPRPLIGLSTHTPEQALQAQPLPLDYIAAGPVRATPTKPDGVAVGFQQVTAAAGVSRVPVVAIGGLDEGASAIEAGADMVAVVRAVCGAPDPRLAAIRLRHEAAGATSWRWIRLNGEPRKSPPGETVLGLLARLGVEPSGVAVEVGGEIVPRERLTTAVVPEGAVVEVVHFVGGG
ncbi:MAG: thiamine phosphate synthase [Candidatus Dormibacteraeota bacterium]|nr:thiamine phosphate synthase [Candidatus Dormibacteraeota bacterium]